MKHREHLLDLTRRHGVLRARDAARAGIPSTYLTRLMRTGELERVGRGLYALTAAEPTEHASLIEAAKLAPKGIICLLSAAAYFGLTTQVPPAVWLALPSGTKAPTTASAELTVVHEGPHAYGEGVIELELDGSEIRIYEPSKTVADMFKFRRRVGLDVALETLKEYWHCEHRDSKALNRYLRVDNVASVVEPYLEMLAT